MLPVDHPVLVAPMAGGPTTPELVLAAGRAGSLGFLAAGYRTVDAVADDLALLESSGLPYGLNVFVPSPPPRDIAPLERYRDELRADAERYGVELPPLRPEDDDAFTAKTELVLDLRPPLVSFTFGAPSADLVGRLRQAGCTVLVTVTDGDAARVAVGRGAAALVVQGGDAGGHASTTAPERYDGTRSAVDVLREVRSLVDVPLVAAGGVGTAADVATLLAAGAMAVQCGTRFLAADEAATRPAHLQALLEGSRDTVVTTAFTGQPARGLRNRFTDDHPVAPLGYPAVHHLTAPIRAAAVARSDPEALNLWAGTGYRNARRAPAAELLAELDPRP